jgi:hypothetical protein
MYHLDPGTGTVRVGEAPIGELPEVVLKLAPQQDWLFELAYLHPEQPDRPTHVLLGMWEQPDGYLYWTMHPLGFDDEEDEPGAVR